MMTAGRMPWYSSGSRVSTDLESSSSASLLHSIYGSQASQLFFADRSISDGAQSEVAVTTGLPRRRTRVRPKSSPVSTMAARMQRQRSSMQLAAVGLQSLQSDVDSAEISLTLQQTLLHNFQLNVDSTESLEAGGVVGPRSRRPTSASVVRLQGPPSAPAPWPRKPPRALIMRSKRPPSAPITKPHGPPTTPPTTRPRRPPSAPITRPQGPPSPPMTRPKRPPSAPMTRPRPPSAPAEKMKRPPSAPTQRRYNRPKTALGISRSSSTILIDLEEEESEQNNPSLLSTPPVNLTRQPEYFNFWLGKPLLERDFGPTVHKRKIWKRPKSDYGNRRRQLQGDGDGSDTGGQGDGVSGLETVQEEGLEGGGDKGRGIGDGTGEDDDGGRRGSKDGGSGGDGMGGETEGDTSNSKKPKKKKSHQGKKSKKGAKKKALLKSVSGTSEASEDDYFTKSNPDTAPWLDSGSTSTPKNSRFELPVDLRTLSDMTPLQYLRKHCVISKRWKTYCSPIFSECDIDKDQKLSIEELKTGLIKAHHSTITLDQVISVLDMVQASSDFMVDVKMFAAFCCLTERLFDLYSIHRPIAEKDIIEKVDFEALNWKLRDCHVNTPLHTLLTYL